MNALSLLTFLSATTPAALACLLASLPILLSILAKAAKLPEAECNQDGLNYLHPKISHPPDVLLSSSGESLQRSTSILS